MKEDNRIRIIRHKKNIGLPAISTYEAYKICRGNYIAYMFDDIEEKNEFKLDNKKALGIDFGINNFATCSTNEGNSFIIDGKKLKSINQWYNKELSRLSSVKDKQKIKRFTKKQYLIARKINKINPIYKQVIYEQLYHLYQLE